MWCYVDRKIKLLYNVGRKIKLMHMQFNLMIDLAVTVDMFLLSLFNVL